MISVRDGVQERCFAALAEHAGDALEVRPNPEQAHDERRVGNQVTGGDDAAHGILWGRRPLSISRANALSASYVAFTHFALQNRKNTVRT